MVSEYSLIDLIDMLPEKTRTRMIQVVRMLALEKYTGKIELDCNQGGVRDIGVSHRLQKP